MVRISTAVNDGKQSSRQPQTILEPPGKENEQQSPQKTLWSTHVMCLILDKVRYSLGQGAIYSTLAEIFGEFLLDTLGKAIVLEDI
jgi:hypothetical protein